ncbi:PAS and ANTAR domain-containing protein [Mycobacterium sp. P7213]|uniref:PAS and ANTAR domain-containing protein n=1 Tax=Mycobacterium sp. P7213 TaxID=2478465 RepID=UPI000F63EB2D|nr:PAS and ANTAR domain-containing protein [Mycobacterium sp. P7213]
MRPDGLGGTEHASELDQALTGGQAQTVGRFQFFIDQERWEWSPEVQQMHGYAPGEMPNPTTAQVLSHKHPDDVDHVFGALEDTRRTRAAFSTRHRMIDTAGRTHQITVVGDLMRDDRGTVVGTEGFYIDISPAEAAYQDRISEDVGAIVDQRAVIEQAKGMLAVVYGLEDAASFELLRWLSQRTNMKLRTLAELLGERFRALSAPVLPERHEYDIALMSLVPSEGP